MAVPTTIRVVRGEVTASCQGGTRPSLWLSSVSDTVAAAASAVTRPGQALATEYRATTRTAPKCLGSGTVRVAVASSTRTAVSAATGWRRRASSGRAASATKRNPATLTA
ncbi:hypothetical protein GCM10020219_007170 [Nonomuraea dietziae]